MTRALSAAQLFRLSSGRHAIAIVSASAGERGMRLDVDFGLGSRGSSSQPAASVIPKIHFT